MDQPSAAPAYSLLALCRNRAGYEAAPLRRMTLDLADVARRLSSLGHAIQGNAGILLAARIDGVDASVFESGKILLKTRDLTAARAAFDAFRVALGWGPATAAPAGEGA